MDKQYFFLSGIARSGSTLLGSLLNQNPDIFVSPTSPLMDFYCINEQTLKNFNHQYTYDYKEISETFNKNLIDMYYRHIDKPYIIDKHRGWPKNIDTMKYAITPHPKVICTWRPIAENIVSFLKLIRSDPNNSVDRELRSKAMEMSTHNRAIHLWKDYSSDPWESLRVGLETNRENIHIVNYHDLVKNPQEEIDKIYNFLDIPKYDHTFNNVTNTCSEVKDAAWGFAGLHNIRSEIKKTSDDPREILGDELMEYFDKFDKMLKI